MKTKGIALFFEKIVNGFAILGNILIVALSLVIIADIISSLFFGESLEWALEISEYLLVYIAFLGATWLLKEDGFIRLDLVLVALKPKMRAFFEIINSIVGLVISLILGYVSMLTTLDMYTRGIKTETLLQVPKFILLLIIPIAFYLLTVQFFIKIITQVKEFKGQT